MKRKLLALLLAAALLALPVLPAAAEEQAAERFALSGICLLDDGAMLVTDLINKVVWRVDSEENRELFAGAIGPAGLDGVPIGAFRDGPAAEARFAEPWAIAPFLDGWAVSDSASNVLRYVTAERVATLAGSAEAGNVDAVGGNARFSAPTGLAADDRGGVYIADTGNGAIRYLASDGRVSTVLTGLRGPTGLYWAEGALYIAETDANRVLKAVDGAVTERWGAYEAAEDGDEAYGGFRDGPAAVARFDHPQGVAVDAEGNVYVADTGNSAVRVMMGGRVYTAVRSEDTFGMVSKPRGLAVRGGEVYLVDAFGGFMGIIVEDTEFYSDVPEDAAYYAPVEELTKRRVFEGTGEYIFSPDLALDRAMFVTLLSRIHSCFDGTAVIDGDGSFDDVPEDAWFAESVRWAVDNGITDGVGDGRFAPKTALTWEMLITMLHRYAVSIGVDVSVGEDTNILSYSDAFELSSWAIPAIQWGCGSSVLDSPDDSLHHDETVTRAQAARVLLRFMDVCGL